MQEQRDNLVTFLWKKRKPLFILTLVGAVGTGLLTYLITPLYLSTAILFSPANNGVPFSEQGNVKTNSFGEDEQTEQMLEIMGSNAVKDKVIHQFDLVEHYGLKPTMKHFQFKLYEAYDGLISINRTKLGAVKIEVLDRDPQLAADIANGIISIYDSVRTEIGKERTVPAYQITKRKLEMLKAEIKVSNEKLDSLANLGVVPDRVRAEIMRAYNNAKSAEDKRYFKERMDANFKFGTDYDALWEYRSQLLDNLQEFTIAFEQAESEANTFIQNQFTVQKATKSDKKDKPKRIVIVLIVAIGTFVFSVFYFLMANRIKDLKRIA